MNENNPNIQTKRELIINLILKKLCYCGKDECPLIYEGYYENIKSRRCKSWLDAKLYCIVDQEGLEFNHEGKVCWTPWEKLEFQNPNFDLVIIEKIKKAFNMPE